MDVYNLHTMQKEEGVSSPLAVVLGNFDGVHAGHADLITRAVTYAEAHGIASAVWTFADGAAALPNKPDVPAITTTEEKLALIGALGVDYAILEIFEAVRGYTPERFVNELLIGKCGASAAVCGFNFRFGAVGCGIGVGKRVVNGVIHGRFRLCGRRTGSPVGKHIKICACIHGSA